MKKDLVLMLAVTIATLLVALGLIRAFEPQLLGGPVDLSLVQLDETQPAFFADAFRPAQDHREFLLSDPLTRVRGRPFYPALLDTGPHDLLGLRNAAIPAAADIVTIGDSMTYGTNAVMGQNWPAWMLEALARPGVNVYNMSMGGWGAVQYLDMTGHAASFRPYVVVVAFYTGNDPMESLNMVRDNPNWASIMDVRDVSSAGLPKFTLDVPPEEQWPVTFPDGVSTVFTPQLRLISNADHPAVDAGYAIMAEVAGLIADKAGQAGMQPVFTIIPTKELAYARKVEAVELEVPPAYRELVTAESARIGRLAGTLGALEGARYVDVIGPLQQAVLGAQALYPDNINGHPLAAGYRVIGETIAAALAGLVPEPYCGVYALAVPDRYFLLLVNREGVWNVGAAHVLRDNGWPEGDYPVAESRRLMRLPQRGVLDRVDPQRFGPAACTGQAAG